MARPAPQRRPRSATAHGDESAKTSHVRDDLVSVAIAIVVVAIGAARIASHASLSRDEAWTALVVHRPIAGVIGLVLGDEANMGPYYIALRLWSVLGSSDGWLRAFSVVGGAGTAVVLFRFVARHFDRRTALLSVALLVGNPVFLTYLTYARGYAWSMFLAASSTALLVRALETGRARSIVAYGVVAGLAVAVNLAAALVVVAQLVGVAWANRWAAHRVRVVAVGVAIVAATFVPFLPVTIARRGANTSWVPRLRARDVVPDIESALGGHDWAWLLGIGLAICLVAIAMPPKAGGIDSSVGVGRLVAAVAVVPAATLVLIGFFQRAFVDRYLTPILPFVAAGAAVGFSHVFDKARLLPRWFNRARLVPALATVAIAAWLFTTGSPLRIEQVEDLRSAAEYLEHNVRPSDAILFYPTWARASIYGYWRPDPEMDIATKTSPDNDLFPVQHTTANLRRLLAVHRRIWLVSYGSRWHPRPEPLEPLVPVLQRRRVVTSKAFSFYGGVQVTLYVRGSPRVAPAVGTRTSS